MQRKICRLSPKERRQIEQAYIQVAIKGAMFSASLQVKVKVIWQFQVGPLITSAKDEYSSHENPATKAASTSFSMSRLSLSLFSCGTMLSMGRSTVFTLFFFFAPPFFSSPFSPTWGKTPQSQISLGRRTGLKLALGNADELTKLFLIRPVPSTSLPSLSSHECSGIQVCRSRDDLHSYFANLVFLPSCTHAHVHLSVCTCLHAHV